MPPGGNGIQPKPATLIGPDLAIECSNRYHRGWQRLAARLRSAGSDHSADHHRGELGVLLLVQIADRPRFRRGLRGGPVQPHGPMATNEQDQGGYRDAALREAHTL